MQILDIPQKSDEWFEVKKGKMSASHADTIGNCGKGLESYIIEHTAYRSFTASN